MKDKTDKARARKDRNSGKAGGRALVAPAFGPLAILGSMTHTRPRVQ